MRVSRIYLGSFQRIEQRVEDRHLVWKRLKENR